MASKTLMDKHPCRYCSQEERKAFMAEHNTDCCKAICEKYLKFVPLQEAERKRNEKNFKAWMERTNYMCDRHERRRRRHGK